MLVLVFVVRCDDEDKDDDDYDDEDDNMQSG